jgi:hypothetical protein
MSSVRIPVCTAVLAVLIDNATRRPGKRDEPMLVYETAYGNLFRVTPHDAAETMFYRDQPTAEASIYLSHSHRREWWQQHIDAASAKAETVLNTHRSPSPVHQPWGWGGRWDINERVAGCNATLNDVLADPPRPPSTVPSIASSAQLTLSPHPCARPKAKKAAQRPKARPTKPGPRTRPPPPVRRWRRICSTRRHITGLPTGRRPR